MLSGYVRSLRRLLSFEIQGNVAIRLRLAGLLMLSAEMEMETFEAWEISLLLVKQELS